MKFYNREKELRSLEQTRKQAFEDHSQFTVMTGRRRIGKTSLILKACEETPTVYLFVSRSNEAILCNKFSKNINQALNVFVPETIDSFADIFEMLMGFGRTMQFNLIIDEFQEFFYINPAVYSEIQDIWDRYRKETHINMIVSGSVYTLMHRIFMDTKEPLYGRTDQMIKLQPFTVHVLKEILSDHNPAYTNDDLLALYTFTGGIPKYIEMLIDKKCYTMPQMVDYMIQENSTFLEEGNILLIQEFGKKYGNYYSILASIASGKNTIPEISSSLGNTSIGGLLKRLETDYEVITKKRPILAKEAAQTVRYEISDNFLRFWFRYIIKYQDYIQSGFLKGLADIIKEDYPTYSGITLEMYFREKLKEQQQFRNIGSWWETSKGKNKEQNEIDIVAIYAKELKVFIAEVKRQRKNFKPELLQQKVETIRTKLFFNYEIETACLTIDDM